jgi:hypothetical protein
MKHRRGSWVLALAAMLPAAAAAAGPTPVLVELFTSEASAASVTADQLLGKLDATAVVLGEHVTLGGTVLWRDRFAGEAMTKRQQAYGDRFRLDRTFVPQMVVNGTAQFLGSDAQRAAQEIAKAAKRVKVVPRLLWVDRGVQVEIDGARVGDRVYLALADDSATTPVTAGENRGKQLHHVAVCRDIRSVGVVPLGGAYYEMIELPPQARSQRVILWIQTGEVGAVEGATMLPPADRE